MPENFDKFLEKSAVHTISKIKREKHNFWAQSHKKRIVALQKSLDPNIKCEFRFSTKQPVATN